MYDPRLQSLRFTVTSPRVWPEDSIVILCGEGYEEWGPQTLDKGMGGSEEAVVYLTRELAKLGWNITVYGEANCQENFGQHYVRWLPWRELDVRDQFNVFVGWRAPQFAERVTARLKLADLHDVVQPESISDDPDIIHMVKSQYHAGLYNEKKPNSTFHIIGNGIKKEQFHEDTK
jgi:hypothetical protein